MWLGAGHGKLAVGICVMFSLAAPAVSEAQEARAPGANPDGAPLLVVSGAREAGEPVALAFQDLSRRDGGAFVDLRESPPEAPVAALELSRAVAAYQAFDYGRAMGHLETALRDAEKSGAASLSTEELSDLFIIRAMVKHGQGDASSAWQDFVQAATIEPSRHLDAVRFSPSNVASFERAREMVSGGPTTELIVSSKPGCSLFVDARSVVAGQAETLANGLHLARVQCPGLGSRAQQLHLVGGQRKLELLPVVPQAPSRKTMVALAKERGFRHLLWTHIASGSGAPATAILELMDVDGKERARTSIALGSAQSTREVALVALGRLLDTLKPAVPVEVIVTSGSTAWYRKPWFWATVGAAVGAALILPFALQDDAPLGFGVSLGGQTP